jgi:uncharacterized membrane-anchored protein YhcB (DUF1043 family)
VTGAVGDLAVRVLCQEIQNLEVQSEAQAEASDEHVRELKLQLHIARHEINLLQGHLQLSTSRVSDLESRLEQREQELQRTNSQLVMHMRQSGSLLAELVQHTEGQMRASQNSSRVSPRASNRTSPSAVRSPARRPHKAETAPSNTPTMTYLPTSFTLADTPHGQLTFKEITPQADLVARQPRVGSRSQSK